MPQAIPTQHALRIIRTGARVRVIPEAGLSGGHEGTVINRRDVPIDGRGIPILPGEGNYKPLARNEVPIREDDGHIFTMFSRCLRVI